MTFRWLLPVGLWALLALVLLVIFYLIKPPYKEKTVSTTLIWKRVLAHKKRQIPLLHHFLIFFLQAALLALLAVSLARPTLFSDDILLREDEHILILDASASMRAKLPDAPEQGTRFERALAAAGQTIEDLLDEKDTSVSLILADSAPHYLFSDLGRKDRETIADALRSAACTTGDADLEKALTLAQSRLDENPSAKIILYTDLAFGQMGSAFTAVDLSDAAREWNVAILGCEVALRDNEYVFEITLGTYGNVAIKQDMILEIRGARNGDDAPQTFHLAVPVTLEGSIENSSIATVQTIVVRATDELYGGQEDWFFDSYECVNISFPALADAIADDNFFSVYGGERDHVDIEYFSDEPNIFWQYGFTNLANRLRRRRILSFREIYHEYGMTVENHGYDIYLFEHSIPEEILEAGLPQDGILLLVDPDSTLSQAGLGLTVGEKVTLPALTACTAYADHPLLSHLDPGAIGLTQYTKITADTDSLFLPLLYCRDDPVMLVKNTSTAKIVILPFSINRSDFYGREFQLFLYNMIDYFFPLTLDKYDYTVNESANVRCKGDAVTVTDEEGRATTLRTFPASYSFSTAGTYTFRVTSGLMRPDEIQKVYVHIAPSESALFGSSDFHLTLDNREITESVGNDLFLYLAIAILTLMMIEWYVRFKYTV